MNKWQKELLEKCKELNIEDRPPLLEEFYILPQNRKHESGYKQMYVIGLEKDEKIYWLLGTYTDVIDLYDWTSDKDMCLSMDIPNNRYNKVLVKKILYNTSNLWYIDISNI